MDKNKLVKGGISLQRDIMIRFMSIALTLAGCRSAAIQSTAIPTPTEIPATSTIVPASTIVPTATIAPKPDYITESNSVQVEDKIIFVKDDNLMSYDQKTGEIKEADISNITFNTMQDASKIAFNLYSEFANQTRDEYFPGGYPNELVYGWSVDKSAWTRSRDESGVQGATIVGIPRAFARVKNPVDFPGYPVLGVAFLTVNGYQYPLPVPIGAFDKMDEYSTMLSMAFNFAPQEYSQSVPGKPASFSGRTTFAEINWLDTQKLLSGNIMVFETVYSVPPDSASTFATKPRSDMDEYIPPGTLTLLDLLIRFQGQQMGGLGFEYAQTSGPNQTTGAMLDAADDQADGSFFTVPLLDFFSIIITDAN